MRIFGYNDYSIKLLHVSMDMIIFLLIFLIAYPLVLNTWVGVAEYFGRENLQLKFPGFDRHHKEKERHQQLVKPGFDIITLVRFSGPGACLP